MTGPGSYSQLPSDFDAFLFATIGDDHDATSLSVNSALARSGLDPWEEAAALARLPAEAATRNLAALIAALPAGPPERADPGTTAARLIALLPHPAAPNAQSRTTQPSFGSITYGWAIKYVVFVVIYTIFMLGSYWFKGREQAAAPVDRGPVPADSRTPKSTADP